MLCYNFWQVVLMKKSQFIIPAIMIVIVFILVCCVILNSNNKEEKIISMEGDWQKETIIYSDSKEFGTIKEKYSLKDGHYDYQLSITYDDTSIESSTLSYNGTYEDKQNYLIIDKKYLYLEDGKLCLEQRNCVEPFSQDTIQYKHELFNFDAQNYIFEVSSIENSEDKSIYLIVKDKCDECETLIKNVSYITTIFDTNLNIINFSKLSKSEKNTLIDYGITEYPTVLNVKNQKILAKLDTSANLTNIAKFLLQNNYKIR